MSRSPLDRPSTLVERVSTMCRSTYGPIVYWHSTDKSIACQPHSIDMSVECWSLVSIATRPRVPLVHMIPRKNDQGAQQGLHMVPPVVSPPVKRKKGNHGYAINQTVPQNQLTKITTAAPALVQLFTVFQQHKPQCKELWFHANYYFRGLYVCNRISHLKVLYKYSIKLWFHRVFHLQQQQEVPSKRSYKGQEGILWKRPQEN